MTGSRTRLRSAPFTMDQDTLVPLELPAVARKKVIFAFDGRAAIVERRRAAATRGPHLQDDGGVGAEDGRSALKAPYTTFDNGSSFSDDHQKLRSAKSKPPNRFLLQPPCNFVV